MVLERCHLSKVVAEMGMFFVLFIVKSYRLRRDHYSCKKQITSKRGGRLVLITLIITGACYF